MKARPLFAILIVVIAFFGVLSQPVSSQNVLPQYGQAQALVTGQATPIGIAVDSAGTVYWANQYTQLRKLPKGATTPTVVLSGLINVIGLGLDAAGNIYYDEYFGGALYKLPAGSGTPQVLLTGLDFPNFMSVDAAGNVFFVTGETCGDKIVEYSTSGTLTTLLTAPQPHDTNHGFGGLFSHPSGDLYYTTCGYNTVNRLPAGSSTPLVLVNTPNTPTVWIGSSGIAVDSVGNVFYTLYDAVYLLPAGNSTPVLLTTQGCNTHEMALDQDDNVFYTDSPCGVIWKIPVLNLISTSQTTTTTNSNPTSKLPTTTTSSSATQSSQTSVTTSVQTSTSVTLSSSWANLYTASLPSLATGGIGSQPRIEAQQTSDGGFLVSGPFGLLKLTAYGAVQWNRWGNLGERTSAWQTSDGGYIVAGGGIILVRLDPTVKVVWQKSYHGGGNDVAESVIGTGDGGFVVVGYTTSFGPFGEDVWLLKLDPSGDVQWQKSYGGGGEDVGYSVRQTSDGGYVVLAYSTSFDTAGNIWLLKLDANGNIQWQKLYRNGYSGVPAKSIEQTPDRGYLVAGTTSLGLWIAKLDSSGNIPWQQVIGSGGLAFGESIYPTSDGGFVVAGELADGSWDALLLKLDANGNIQWQEIYGGNDDDYVTSIRQSVDGGYVVVGSTYNRQGNYPEDVWVLKLDVNGRIPNCPQLVTVNASHNDASVQDARTNGFVVNTNGVVSTINLTPNDQPIGALVQCQGPVSTSTGSSTFQTGSSFSQTATLTVTVTTTFPTSLTMSSQSNLGPVTVTYLQLSSNSTISNLQFDSARELINFTASGPSGTVGSTSVVFAKTLISGTPTVLIDNGNTSPISITLTSNSTHYSLTVTYPHSTHSITIGGSNSIPEFGNLTAFLLAVVSICAVVILPHQIKRRK